MHTTTLAARIWFISSLILDAGILIASLFFAPREWYVFLPAFLAILAAGIPVFITMAVLLPVIRRFIDSFNHKIYLTILTCGACAFIYGLAGFFVAWPWKYQSEGWLYQRIGNRRSRNRRSVLHIADYSSTMQKTIGNIFRIQQINFNNKQ